MRKRGKKKARTEATATVVNPVAAELNVIAADRRRCCLRDPEDIRRVADRVVQIALTSNDPELTIKAAAELRQMVALDLKIDQPNMKRIEHEHHHTHEVGTITESNFAEAKKQLIARIARVG